MTDSPDSSTNPTAPAGGTPSVQEAGTPEEHLKHFCEAVLDLLQAGSAKGSVLSHVLPSLVRAISECSAGAVAHLKQEMRSWETASEQLKQLANSPFAQFGEEAEGLLVKLERARGQAARAIDALEAMQMASPHPFAPSDTTLHAALDVDDKRQPALPAVVSKGRSRQPAEQHAGSDQKAAGEGEDDDAQPPGASHRIGRVQQAAVDDVVDDEGAEEEQPAPELSDTDLAAALYHKAEKCLEEQDAEEAETLYTMALERAPHLRLALLQRGRIRLVRGAAARAIDDFTNALLLDDDDAQTHGWRGDAHALCGRNDEAVDDYTRALELRPDLILVRYNRAVALRQGGQLDRSLAEFDQLVRLKPAHGPLYLNRGLIWHARGSLARAAAEFRTALRYQPSSEEAIQRLREVEIALEEQSLTRAAELVRQRGTDKADSSQAKPKTQTVKPAGPNAPLAPSADSASRSEYDGIVLVKPEKVPGERKKRNAVHLPAASRAALTTQHFNDDAPSDDDIALAALETPPESPQATAPVAPATRLVEPARAAEPSLAPSSGPSTAELSTALIGQAMLGTALPSGISDGPPVGLRPGSRTSAPQYADYQNCSFQCPSCGCTSTVRWDRLQLGKVLACPRCQKNLTVTGDGRLKEVVKDRHGRWKEARGRIDRAAAGRLAASSAGVLLLICALFWMPTLFQGSSTTEAALPLELEPRAKLFGWAWLKGDYRLMRRLTDPVQGEMLFEWYKEHPAPAVRTPATVEKDVMVRVDVLPGESPTTHLRLSFLGLQVAQGTAPKDLPLAWEERKGGWSFLPSAGSPVAALSKM